MKGKGLSLKIILCVLAIITAGVCFNFHHSIAVGQGVYAASTKVELTTSGEKEEYSALFGGNIIFSVEKVLVGDYGATADNIKTFIGTTVNALDKVEDKEYKFKNIQAGTSKKTVIDNGMFAVLNNRLDQYGNLVSKKDQGDDEVLMYGEEEALMISFGSYVYTPDDESTASNEENVKIADKDKTIFSKITYLDIVLEKDGKQVPKDKVPSIRNINIVDKGLFFDFVFLLKQEKNNSNEGHYKFSFNYMVNSVEYNEEFEFYLINELSYRETTGDASFGYNAKPTIGWTGGSQFEQTGKGNHAKYKEGEDGLGVNQISYPTITYDYTKYNLSFTHTANLRNTLYEFDCQYNKTLNNQGAQLNYAISSSANVEKGFIKLNDYRDDSAINLVTIMLTEPGSYVVNYSLIYDGFKSETAPDVGVAIEPLKVTIHGLDAHYSKTDFESAIMQYAEIITTKGNHVDLFIPHGYEVSSNVEHSKNEKLGFAYKLVVEDFVEGQSETGREGNVILANSINTLINANLKNKIVKDDINAYSYLSSEIEKLNSESLDLDSFNNLNATDSDLNKVMSWLDEGGYYAQTNQGSIWLSGNDTFTPNSFYFHSTTPIKPANMFGAKKDSEGNQIIDAEGNPVYTSSAKQLTNQTSFNSKGYYLVFAQVKPVGSIDEAENYWQIFAFQYTSSSININVEAIGENNELEIIAGGKYTNKNVVVSWKKPGVFDREIKGYYYSVLNNNADKESLLGTAKHELATEERTVEGVNYYSAYLGSEVLSGNFVKYLIRLESEGESATHKIFTIDRQDISGIQPYLVKEMNSGNSVFYTFATDAYNYAIPIINSITNGYAALSWNNKLSGAETYASYSYTPFVQNDSEPAKITGNWISSNYQLGTTIRGLSLDKASVDAYSLSGDNVLTNQGIYIIRIWDSAGNECYYAFVIDRTENYFELNGNFVNNSLMIFGDDVEYNIGDFKALGLSSTDNDLNSFIQLASSNNVSAFKNGKYYAGNNSNRDAISKYFQKVGNKYYFTVQNKMVVGFDSKNISDNNIQAIQGTLNYSIKEGEGFYRRTLYVVAENHTYLNVINSSHPDYENFVRKNAYAIVEINKDNARGMAYYSNDSITYVPDENDQSSSVKRFEMYGSDERDSQGNLISKGIMGARATSATNLAFAWNMGVGNFEVEYVGYTFYSLKPNEYNNDTLYYYGSPEQYDIYKDGKINGEGTISAEGRAIYQFNYGNQAREGLYVVTRQYRKDLTVELGDDVREKNYYFIVDRKQIIDLNVGTNIKLLLLENEEEFTNFSIGGTNVGTFSYNDDNIKDQRYNIYLNTHKLPVTLNIPTGKYSTNEGSSGEYYAGKLNVSVYFNDTYGQLDKQFRYASIKIFDSGYKQFDSDVYEIDIYDYLTRINRDLRDRITESEENVTWLFLPGDYILKITDNVVDMLDQNHTMFIGFRINGTDNVGPQIDAFNDFDTTDMVKINQKYNGLDANRERTQYEATVSQEYLKVVLPAYEIGMVEKAQVDPNYIIVKQYYDENESFYLNHPYEPKNGINLKDTNSDIVSIENGKLNICLDTKLRDASGNIDLENLHKPLRYEVIVRFKIGKDGDNERFKNCYIYYDTNGNKVSYFEAKYTIIIDREAPKANIEALNKTDVFVEEYNELYGTSSMIENGVHETSSNLYFTKQYAKYYQTGKTNKGYIYAYQVGANTTFDESDVYKVYYKRISEYGLLDLATYNLALPLVDETKYDGYKLANTFNGYVGLGLAENNYYEIVEMDHAGNATQYVIHYEPSDLEIDLPITLIQTEDGSELYGHVRVSGFVADGSAPKTSVNIYDLSANGQSSIENASFIKIELTRAGGETVLALLTNATSDFENLNQTIVQTLKAQLYGNFNMVISYRTLSGIAQSVITFNLYDKSKVVVLDIENLIVVNDGKYYINLAGANSPNEDKTIWFFATKITIKSSDNIEDVYVGEISRLGEVIYYNKVNSEKVEGYIECASDTTYYLTMTDVLGNVSKHRFRTTVDDYEFYKIKFENPFSEGDYGEYYFQSTENIYYGYTTAKVEYDNTFAAKLFIKEGERFVEQSGISGELFEFEAYETYSKFLIKHNYKDSGKIVEARVDIFEKDGTFEKSYNIVIDTRLSSVALRDFNSGEVRSTLLKPFNNKEYTDENVRADSSGSGIMNLQWAPVEENDYFDYTYTLYELKKDESYVQHDLNSKSNFVIATSEDSKGIYKFVIEIKSKNGITLGNKIYAFEVQEVSTQIYYVRNEQGEAIKENSSFKLSDLSSDLQSKISGIHENVNVPLYVTNQDLAVVVTAVNVEPSVILDENYGNYSFKIHKLTKQDKINDTDVFNIYIGILKIINVPVVTPTSVKIITSGESVSDTFAVTDKTTFTIVGYPSDSVELCADVTIPEASDTILRKNVLLLDVYYNNKLVKTEIMNDKTTNPTSRYLIKGNGQYSFMFKDLAGNVHQFINGSTRLDVYVLREVVVTINDAAPVDNGFYNDEVSLSVYASSEYVTGSIEVKATKNGLEYTPTGFNPYVFSEYGTYRVEIVADYIVENEKKDLSKVVTFTIINTKEARKSIDLTGLNGSKITKVLNTYGEDKTSQFNKMLNGSNGGMNISYENVMLYESFANKEDKLNVTAGKITFTLTYLVSDEIYPDREVTFSFTLNNEDPVIECSLEKGGSTKKHFSIYFNAAILYDQIGEAYIYINNRQVAHITEDSANAETEVKTSFKEHGDGDFYIQLVSSSGVVWDSYKVTIKEPLNFWAIIVIIVVVGIVGTITVTIIVLRRKMRIR